MSEDWISSTLRQDPTWTEIMRKLRLIRKAADEGCMVVRKGEEQR